MNPDIEQLKKDIQELKDWKSMKERQQISYPLDIVSPTVLKDPLSKVLFITGTAKLNGAGAAEFPIGAFDNNPVFAQDEDGVSLATGIVNSDITPGFTKLYLAGQANHFIRYIIFTTLSPNNP
jgi:hypothetical protein